MVYISCASWKTLAGDVGVDAMVLAVLCNVAGACFLMVLIVGSVQYYEGYQKRSEERNQGEQMTLVQTVVQAVRQETVRRTLFDKLGGARPAASGAKGGGGIAAAAKKMEHHLGALASICQELQMHGRPAAEDDGAEEGHTQPAAAEAA